MVSAQRGSGGTKSVAKLYDIETFAEYSPPNCDDAAEEAVPLNALADQLMEAHALVQSMGDPMLLKLVQAALMRVARLLAEYEPDHRGDLQ